MKERARLLKKNDNDFKDKSEMLITFLESYVESGDKKAAWEEAGYAIGGLKNASKMIRDNYRLVEKLIRDRIGSHVPMALEGVVELATNAKQESVRLKALQDILYRAGYDKPIEIVTSEKEVRDMDNKELEDELTKLLARSNSEATEELH